jgi:hypothetical protein
MFLFTSDDGFPVFKVAPTKIPAASPKHKTIGNLMWYLEF